MYYSREQDVREGETRIHLRVPVQQVQPLATALRLIVPLWPPNPPFRSSKSFEDMQKILGGVIGRVEASSSRAKEKPDATVALLVLSDVEFLPVKFAVQFIPLEASVKLLELDSDSPVSYTLPSNPEPFPHPPNYKQIQPKPDSINVRVSSDYL